MPLTPFEYRIVAPRGGGFMPQRGVIIGDSLSGRYEWVDAVPVAAPTMPVAEGYVKSLNEIDSTRTEGTIVWKSPTAP